MKHGCLAITVVAFLLAACSGGIGAASPAASSAPRTIEVSTLDNLRFEPDSVTVAVGETVTFRVHNAGRILHDFFIGDEEAQDEHESEMAGGGMAHGENGISVEPGETGTLEITFAEAGELLIGCHQPGHYGGGMQATIEVQP